LYRPGASFREKKFRKIDDEIIQEINEILVDYLNALIEIEQIVETYLKL
jgi:hypothetical protein